MAVTITSVRESDTTAEPVFLVTRREATVLAVALAVVVAAILLLVVASGQVASALAAPN